MSRLKANLVAYGLIGRHMDEARPFVEVFNRDSILGGEFSETLELGSDNMLTAAGIKPSLCTALSIIEFTWLMNNARYEAGMSVANQ